MDYHLLILALTLSAAAADLSLDPLQDPDQDFSTNVQDKRTICAALNKCTGNSASYVKRVVVKPSIVGYRPSVVRPVAVKPSLLGGYRYTKPKVHFSLKAPGGWKPIDTPVKPVVEVVKPENHVDVIHNNLVPHVDHLHLRPGHVHLQPAVPVGAHLDQVHQISIPHGGHYDTFTHVDHIHPVEALRPSPVLFEVTRPNLGVLPLGSRFLTPVLKQAPHVHHLHAVAPPPIHVAPVAPPHIHVAPVVPSPIPVAAPLPLAPAPVAPTPILPHPAFSVEYHGTRNYLPLAGALPVIPQPTFIPHQHVLSQPQALPFDHPAHGFVPQQALPHEHQQQFLRQEQQLPHQYQQQLQAIQEYQDIPQGQLPLEGEPGVLNYDQSTVIQPGQTDLQIPYHLPQHGSWQGEEGFRPSQQLEAPYHK
ncbi:uncharacterized protein [Euwallacea similis]|uniref:uncharacterized protein n=1 Tax=Euwallacea similis TaxID=1736056 RepID=UPI0034501B4B